MELKFGPKNFPPEAQARAIAEEVLLHYQIRGLHGLHRITAVEFYVNGPNFCDTSNHCHPLQLQSGHWYVHTAKSLQSFKAPRYSGIDLACGDSKHGIHAGMLIRQLDGEGGSGLAIMKLMRGNGIERGNLPAGSPQLKWSEQEKQKLSELQGADVFQAPIRLERLKQPALGTVVAKKRIGIAGTSHEDLLMHFALKLHSEKTSRPRGLVS